MTIQFLSRGAIVLLALTLVCSIGCGPSQVELNDQKIKKIMGTPEQRAGWDSDTRHKAYHAIDDLKHTACATIADPGSYFGCQQPFGDAEQQLSNEDHAPEEQEDAAYAAGRNAMDNAARNCHESKGECSRVWSAAYDAITKKYPGAYDRENRRDAGRISARESVEDTKARVGFLTGCRDGYTTDSAGTMHCNEHPIPVRIVP